MNKGEMKFNFIQLQISTEKRFSVGKPTKPDFVVPFSGRYFKTN